MNVEYSKSSIDLLKETFPWLKSFNEYSNKVAAINSVRDLQELIEELTIQNPIDQRYKSFLHTLRQMEKESNCDAKFQSYLRLFAYLILYCSVIGYNGAAMIYQALVMSADQTQIAGRKYPKQAYTPNYFFGEFMENLVDKLFIKEAVLRKAIDAQSNNYVEIDKYTIQKELCSHPIKVKHPGGGLEIRFNQVRFGNDDSSELPIILPEFSDANGLEFPSNDALRAVRTAIHKHLGFGEEKISPSKYIGIDPMKLLEIIQKVKMQFGDFLIGVDFETLFTSPES